MVKKSYTYSAIDFPVKSLGKCSEILSLGKVLLKSDNSIAIVPVKFYE